jgi:hypothetical protein
MTTVLHADGTNPYDKLMRQIAECDENKDRVLTTLYAGAAEVIGEQLWINSVLKIASL